MAKLAPATEKETTTLPSGWACEPNSNFAFQTEREGEEEIEKESKIVVSTIDDRRSLFVFVVFVAVAVVFSCHI